MSYYDDDDDYINDNDNLYDESDDDFNIPSKPINIKRVKSNNSDDENELNGGGSDGEADGENEDDDDDNSKENIDDDGENDEDNDYEDEDEDYSGNNFDNETKDGYETKDDYETKDNNESKNNTNVKKTTIKKSNKSNNKKKIIENQSDDEDEDEDEDDDKNYLQKFNEGISKNYILDYHPECVVHNYNEVLSMCQVMRDANGIIIDDLHMTIPQLTKYERARILGLRAKQINSGATPFIKVPEGVIDGYLIAQMELKEKKIPFIIRRPMPNGGSEYWYLKDLEDILF